MLQMMFGAPKIPEGQNPPRKYEDDGRSPRWGVWCNAGLLEVLRKREFVEELERNPKRQYWINCHNQYYVDIAMSDELWKELVEITKTHRVEVYQMSLRGGWIPWDGTLRSIHRFDAVQIKPKASVFSRVSRR